MSDFLYRHFAADGELLYAGISLSWPTRTKSHVRGSPWFDQVAEVKIEKFATRQQALQAEKEAIKTEKPRFNVIHNRPSQKAKPERQANLRIKPGDYVAFKAKTIFGNKPKGVVTSICGGLVDIEKDGGGLAHALIHQVRKINPSEAAHNA